jgi:hypothetical protein
MASAIDPGIVHRAPSVSCDGHFGRGNGAHANEPKASSVESNPIGLICGSLATLKRTELPDAHWLIYPSIAAGKNHQN